MRHRAPIVNWISVLSLAVVCAFGLPLLTLANEISNSELLLKQADAALADGNFPKAKKLYRSLKDHIEQQSNQRIAIEALDGLAAVSLLTDDFVGFQKLRRVADAKRRRIPQLAHAHDRSNLISGGDWENGLILPWGTGRYEREVRPVNRGMWWNSTGQNSAGAAVPTMAFMKVDHSVYKTGHKSLRITNLTQAGHNRFITTAQRIENLQPHSVFRLSLFAKAQEINSHGLRIVVDPAWQNSPITLPGGSYGWRHFVAYFTNGFHTSLDVRLLLENIGTQWIDDFRIEKIRLDEVPHDMPGHVLAAEVLFGRGDHARAQKAIEYVAEKDSLPLQLRLLRSRIIIERSSNKQALKEALETLEELARRSFGHSLLYLGHAYIALGKETGAIEAYRAYAIRHKNDQIAVAEAKAALARAYISVARKEISATNRGRLLKTAEQYLNASLRTISHVGEGERLIDVTHLQALQALNKEDHTSALGYFHKGFVELKKRTEHASALPRHQRSLLLRKKSRFVDDYLETLYEVALKTSRKDQHEQHLERAFAVVQRRQLSEASIAITEMTDRIANKNKELSRLIRRQQSFAARKKALTEHLEKALFQGTQKAAEAAQKIESDLEAIIEKLEQTVRLISEKFPRFQSLQNPKLPSLEDLRAVLSPREALLLLHEVKPAKTERGLIFVFMVTRDKLRWLNTDLTSLDLAKQVITLRCGLDRSGGWSWSPDEKKWVGRNNFCVKLRPNGLRSSEPLPFDTDTAHNLYLKLFNRLEGTIAKKTLLIIPVGALRRLPLQVLLTRKPQESRANPRFSQMPWLIKDHAIAMIPSVDSLVSLRAEAKHSAAPNTYLGLGDPTLEGNENCVQSSQQDGCPDQSGAPVSSWIGSARNAKSLLAVQNTYRSGLANVEKIRRLCPLPETALELSCVGRSLGAKDADIILRANMTETFVKSANLSNYKIVHFATHGLLASDTRHLTEPALLMTPPRRPTQRDDGLLTSSEIARLTLDADWVILSACNSAAGQKLDTEPLSGLARAFFFAGARAVLVSHWPVNSYSATMLISETFTTLSRRPEASRSEALQTAMLSLISNDENDWTGHPSMWAPFVIVGESGKIDSGADRQ